MRYYYPWLPARCKLCDKWGHGEAVCVTKGKGRKRNEESRPTDLGRSYVKAAQSQNKESEIPVEVAEVRHEEIRHEEVNNVLELEEVLQHVGKDEKEGVVDSGNIVRKEKEDKGDQESNLWSLVSPEKKGRTSVSPVHNIEVRISASKFLVLCENEIEEGELLNEEQHMDDIDLNEEDKLEDNNVEQQVREEIKAGRRGWKPKAQGANPAKSTRSS